MRYLLTRQHLLQLWGISLPSNRQASIYLWHGLQVTTETALAICAAYLSPEHFGGRVSTMDPYKHHK